MKLFTVVVKSYAYFYNDFEYKYIKKQTKKTTTRNQRDIKMMSIEHQNNNHM